MLSLAFLKRNFQFHVNYIFFVKTENTRKVLFWVFLRHSHFSPEGSLRMPRLRLL